MIQDLVIYLLPAILGPYVDHFLLQPVKILGLSYISKNKPSHSDPGKEPENLHCSQTPIAGVTTELKCDNSSDMKTIVDGS